MVHISIFSSSGVVHYDPLRASSYLHIPAELSRKKACLNIKNRDNKCFLWCILASLHPIPYQDNPNRASKYYEYEGEMNMNGIEYPVAIKDIDRFEKQNEISVNVYGYEDASVFPMRITKQETCQHVNLLYVSENNISHYVLIKDLSRLITKQLSNRNGRGYVCKFCLHLCQSQDTLDRHVEKCQLHEAQRIKMPEKGEDKLRFTKVEYQSRLPFVIYADFESILENNNMTDRDPSRPWTEKYQTHIPCSFGMYTVCTDKRFYSKPKIYFGEDSAEKFIDCIQREAKMIHKFLENKIPMEKLSSQQWQQFKSALKCHICQKDFKENEKRVRDHDHLTGNFSINNEWV